MRTIKVILFSGSFFLALAGDSAKPLFESQFLAEGKSFRHVQFNEYSPANAPLTKVGRLRGVIDFLLDGGFEFVEKTELSNRMTKVVVRHTENQAQITAFVSFTDDGLLQTITYDGAGSPRRSPD